MTKARVKDLADDNKTTELYRKTIEEIEDYAIILLDKNGIIQNWNKGAEKIKLYREEEVVGQHFSIFYLTEDLERGLPDILVEKATMTGKAAQQCWRRRKDGSKFWGSITITAIHDDENNVIGFSKVTRDLTEKKMADDKLRMSEERYHQMVAEIQDYAIILLNENGIIQNWNAGAAKIKGYAASEIIGRSFEIFYPPADRDNNLPASLLEIARTEGRAIHEGWRLRKDGTRFWGTIVITALHGRSGQIIGFTKVTRDLTTQKITSDKLKDYTRQLEIQNSELEQFAYVASHDLQEPLRKIQTFAELIQENYHDKAFVKTYFKKLDASAKRMSQLVRSLLNFSRITKEIDNRGLEKKPVDLNQVLESVKTDLELSIAVKNAHIRSNDLPVIRGLQTQMEQLFSNLVSNSIKFCESRPQIHISASVVNRQEIPQHQESLTEARYHKITFRDNGIGFEQQYDKIIFTLFQRLHGKHEFEGTGIGLALCKRIVENHNGHIEAHSSPGIGAVFNVYLPLS